MTAPRPIGWSPDHTHTGGCHNTGTGTWRDCPTCWAQGRILHASGWSTCPTCLGVRQIHEAR